MNIPTPDQQPQREAVERRYREVIRKAIRALDAMIGPDKIFNSPLAQRSTNATIERIDLPIDEWHEE